MSDATGAAKFSCDACNRQYTWKAELAGRRVKCKCGAVMTVPQEVAQPEPELDALYDLAPTEEEPVQKIAPLKAPVGAAAAAAIAAPGGGAAAKGKSLPRGTQALGYQRGPTQKEKDRFSNATLVDLKRDVYVPTGLLVGSMLVYVGYYALRYNMGFAGILAVGFGLSLLTLIKTVLLIGFAFTVATPLGVSFGGVGTAVLKLAAIATSCDALLTLVDAGMVKLAGPGGAMYGYIFDFFISVGVYWGLLIYLFNMDPGDSYMVVAILSVFDMIVRTALMIFLMATIMSWGGIASSAVPLAGLGGGGGGSGGGKSSVVDPVDEILVDAKESNRLKEAKEYIDGGRQGVFGKSVADWYAAGCKNVWFEMSHGDINGRQDPEVLIVELPPKSQKEARLKCFQILRQCYKDIGRGGSVTDSDPVVDTGEKYITVDVP